MISMSGVKTKFRQINYKIKHDFLTIENVVLVIAIISAELGNLVSKKTKVDIIVTPLVTILPGLLLTVLTAKYINGYEPAPISSPILVLDTEKPATYNERESVAKGDQR